MRGSFFLRFMIMFLVLSLGTVGVGFLFAATADTTGLVSLLPLFAVFALIGLGTVMLLRKALR